MAALSVFQQVGKVADADFLATDVLPVLWQFSLGPLLDLSQFQAFMKLVKKTSTRIEEEHTRKLSELAANAGSSRGTGSTAMRSPNKQSDYDLNGTFDTNGDDDFESLVTGRKSVSKQDDLFDAGWGNESSTQSTGPAQRQTQSQKDANLAQFSSPSAAPSVNNTTNLPSHISRTVTPDTLGSFKALTPSSGATTAPSTSMNGLMQPQYNPQQHSSFGSTMQAMQPQRPMPPTSTSIDWSRSSNAMGNSLKPQQFGNNTSTQFATNSSFSSNNFGIPPPPHNNAPSMNIQLPTRTPTSMPNTASAAPKAKQGLDKYESLI